VLNKPLPVGQPQCNCTLSLVVSSRCNLRTNAVLEVSDVSEVLLCFVKGKKSTEVSNFGRQATGFCL
jgi:hypothetical protein